MFKTFSTGVILGLIAAGAAAHFVPLFDLQREASIISVQPNGGNLELFQIQLPSDRIVAGQDALPNRTPDSLLWPDAPRLSGTGLEVFKVRNSSNRVIGLASRFVLAGVQSTQSVEWMLYLPARGSMYVSMPAAPASDGGRIGTLRAGTREFSDRHGDVTERYLASDDGTGADGGIAGDGRIELRARLVATETGKTGGTAP